MTPEKFIALRRDLRAALKQLTDYAPAMPDEEILRRLLALNLARATPSTGAPS